MASLGGRIGGVVVIAAVLMGVRSTSGQTFLEPGTPYLSEVDSPFADLITSGDVILEDFEDDMFSPGFTSITGGVRTSGGNQTDSVDGDDDMIDGSGSTGSSFFSTFPNGTDTFTFVFDEVVLGGLPTHAGIVWTDVGQNDVTGFGEVTFEAFDGGGNSLGTIGPVGVGDGSTFGETGEDRFFGVIHPGGILRIAISMDANDWEVDHLQYGTPEPATVAMVMGAGLVLIGSRRRRRSQNLL